MATESFEEKWQRIQMELERQSPLTSVGGLG